MKFSSGNTILFKKFQICIILQSIIEFIAYKTVPRTARVPEYGANIFQVKDRESNNIEAAWLKRNKKWSS